jgi:drug/metabolite transporter (DMT)-like permease
MMNFDSNFRKNLSNNQSKRLKGIFLVILASACWSTSGIIIITILQMSPLSPVGLAFWRDLMTSLVLLLGILIARPNLLKIKWKDLPWLAGMGVISIGSMHFFWNKAVVVLGASLATVLQYNSPILVTILACFFFDEALTSRKIAAIFLAAIGTVMVAGLLTGNGLNIQPNGLIIALLSSISFASLSLFGKKLSQEYDPWSILFYIFSFGTITLFLYQSGSPDSWPQGSGIIIWVLVLVLISTILGFGAYTKALTYLPASIASITTTSEILFASTLAYSILGEYLGIWQIFGAVLIITGVVVVSQNNSNSSIKVAKR